VNVSAAADEFEELGDTVSRNGPSAARVGNDESSTFSRPTSFYVGVISESDFPRHGKSNHDLTQEIEVGLPRRFEVGIENDLGIPGVTRRR